MSLNSAGLLAELNPTAEFNWDARDLAGEILKVLTQYEVMLSRGPEVRERKKNSYKEI